MPEKKRVIAGHEVQIEVDDRGQPVRVKIAGERRQLSIRENWVKCGNKRCKTCPHGPYLVGTFSWKGKTRTIHLGSPRPKMLNRVL